MSMILWRKNLTFEVLLYKFKRGKELHGQPFNVGLFRSSSILPFFIRWQGECCWKFSWLISVKAKQFPHNFPIWFTIDFFSQAPCQKIHLKCRRRGQDSEQGKNSLMFLLFLFLSAFWQHKAKMKIVWFIQTHHSHGFFFVEAQFTKHLVSLFHH